MVLPVFTGVKPFIDQPNWAPPIDAYEAKGYLLGTQIAKNQPSTITAAVEGLQKGLEQKQAAERNSAEIEKLRMEAEMFPESEQARINANNAAAVLAQTRAENEADPYSPENRLKLAQTAEAEAKVEQLPAQQEILRLQQQAAIAKSRTELLKAQNEAGKYARENQDNEFREQQKFNLGEITSVIGAPDRDPEDLIDILHKDVGKIVRAATPLNSKENIVNRDTDVDTLVDGFVEKVRDAYPDRADIIGRAEEFKAAYSLGVNRRIDATNKKSEGIPTTPTELRTPAEIIKGGGRGSAAAINSTLDQLAGKPARPTQTQEAALEQADSSVITGEPPAPRTPVGASEERILMGPPRQEDEAMASFQAKAPVYQQQVLQNRLSYYRSQGLEPKDAATRAFEDMKEARGGAELATEIRKTATNIESVTLTAQKLRGIIQKLEQIKQKAQSAGVKFETPVGPSSSLNQWAIALKGKLGSDIDGELDNYVIKPLEGIGTEMMMSRVGDANATYKIVDSAKEQDNMKALDAAPSNSIEQNLSALSLLDAKLRQTKAKISIIDFYRSSGFGTNEGEIAARAYAEANPTSVISTIGGRPYPVENTAAQTPGEFLKGYLKLDQASGGRKKESVPANPFVPRPTTPDGTPPHGGHIPNFMPGGATDEYLDRLESIESSGNVNAENPNSTAKGPYQFIDSTGKAYWSKAGLDNEKAVELWNKMGFDLVAGPYNPKDKVRGRILAAAYMKELLPLYGNDTRIASVAYLLGAPTVSKIYDIATKSGQGDISWDVFKMYLPERATIAGKTLPVREMALQRVEQIMDDKGVARRAAASGIESLSTPAQQQAANERLTPEGKEALRVSSGAKTIEEARSSPIWGIIQDLADPNYGTKPSLAKDALNVGAATVAGGPAGFASSLGAALGRRITVEDLKELPSELHSGILGAGRGLAFGWDNELGARWRVGVSHVLSALGVGGWKPETYQEALSKVDAIRTAHQREHPGWYLAGDLAGPVLLTGGIAEGLAGVRTMRGMEPVAKLAPEAPKIIGSMLKGFGWGAAGGAARGAGENESDRGMGALVGGGVGALTGAVAGGTIAGVAKYVDSKTMAGMVEKVRDYKAGRTAQPFTVAEAKLAEPLWGLPPEKIKEAAIKMGASVDDAEMLATAIDSETNFSAVLDLFGKHPITGAETQTMAGKILDTRNASIRNAPEWTAKNPQMGINEANEDFVEMMGTRAKGLVEERRDLAGPDFAAGEALLPKGVTSSPTSKPVPVFNGPAMQEAAKNRFIKAALREAKTQLKDLDDDLPLLNSEVVQQAKTNLGVDSQAGGNLGRNAKAAHDQLAKAMYAEEGAGDFFKKADEAYAAGSQAIKQFGGSRAVAQILKFADESKTTDASKAMLKFLGYDVSTIKKIMGGLDEEESKVVQQALQSHVMEVLESLGTRQKGKVLPWSAGFRQNRFPEKVKAIYGEERGSKIVDMLEAWERKSDVLNTILGKGSQTASRLMQVDELNEEAAKKVADAIASVGIFGKGGIPQSLRSLADLVESKPDMRELTREMSHILIGGRKNALGFLKKVEAEMERRGANEAFLNDWRRYVRVLNEGLQDLAFPAGAGAEGFIERESPYDTQGAPAQKKSFKLGLNDLNPFAATEAQAQSLDEYDKERQKISQQWDTELADPKERKLFISSRYQLVGDAVQKAYTAALEEELSKLSGRSARSTVEGTSKEEIKNALDPIRKSLLTAKIEQEGPSPEVLRRALLSELGDPAAAHDENKIDWPHFFGRAAHWLAQKGTPLDDFLSDLPEDRKAVIYDTLRRWAVDMEMFKGAPAKAARKDARSR